MSDERQVEYTEENLPPESREYLESLVKQYRELAVAKDSVIAMYRNFLEQLKPFVAREEAHIAKYSFFYKEIRTLKDQLEELTRKMPKKKRKKETV